MKVKELIAKLEKYDGDMEIMVDCLTKDSYLWDKWRGSWFVKGELSEEEVRREGVCVGREMVRGEVVVVLRGREKEIEKQL